MLTGPEIKRQIIAGNIVIRPFCESRLNPNSYNLRLGGSLKVYEKAFPLHAEWDQALLEAERLNHYYGDEYAARARKKGFHTPCYGKRRMIEPLDCAVEEKIVDLFIPPEGIILWPNVLYLGHTEEYTETRCFVPTIEGRSGVGRMGIQVHLTAGFGDVHFQGDWTLEVLVVHPVRVYAGMEVCQIAYTAPVGEILPYRGNYQGQRGPKSSMLWKEFTPRQEE